jgi:hypothetical protein
VAVIYCKHVKGDEATRQLSTDMLFGQLARGENPGTTSGTTVGAR